MKNMRLSQGRLGVQCNGFKSPCEPSGENCQDQPHSAVYSNAHGNPNDGPKHPKMRWPARAEREMWKEVDKDLNTLMEGTVKGPLKMKLVIFNNIIYNYGEERFGLEKKGGGNQVKCQILSRWQQEIKDLRKELKNLSKKWKIAKKSNDWNRIVGLDDLRFEHRERLKVLRKAERLRRKRKQQVRERSNFYEDPFKFMESLFPQDKSGVPKVARQKLEEHLRRTYSDSDRNRDLPWVEDLVRLTEPGVPFDLSPPCRKEVDDFIEKARSSSAPGPNEVPYRVFKSCPKVTHRLWHLLCIAWNKEIIAPSWNKTEGIYLPKEENSIGIPAFHPISLLNVDGKIFFGILARRLSKFLIGNGYIDMSIQKAGVPGSPGCIEHMAMI